MNPTEALRRIKVEAANALIDIDALRKRLEEIVIVIEQNELRASQAPGLPIEKATTSLGRAIAKARDLSLASDKPDVFSELFMNNALAVLGSAAIAIALGATLHPIVGAGAMAVCLAFANWSWWQDLRRPVARERSGGPTSDAI